MVEHDGRLVGSVDLTREGSAGASLRWALYAGHRGHGHAARAVRVLVDWAFSDPDQGGWGLQRVEARIDPRNDRSRRVATRAGMRLEGVQRIAPGMGDRADATSYAVFARLATDPPLSDPESFRSLLNSFLPRKRAISQMLVRDPEGRVLLCQLTYKRDWDLPGGVVEVGESPRLAVQREVEEELGLDIEPGDLLLTDWLPAWGGWDDAVCLVFDGGTHGPEVLARRGHAGARDPRRALLHAGGGRRAGRRLHLPEGAGRGRGRSAVYGVRSLRQDAFMTWVYDFAEGSKDKKDLLGGKGANLAEMTNLGLPVPPGFTISTETCRAYLAEGGEPEGLAEEVTEHLAALEEAMGKKLGDADDPLLVSVRSGAKFSMPGMMETVLNVGLNDTSVGGLAARSESERFALDSYRRLLQMFGGTVLHVDSELFSEALDEAKKANGTENDLDLDADDLRGLVETFKGIIRTETGHDFPQDPREQMDLAIRAVFDSWNTDRARLYRRQERIPEDLGTAVNVQAMVFGNFGMDSGSGVAFTRDPASGAQGEYGDYLQNAQGEDVVAGIRNTVSLADMAEIDRTSHDDLMQIMTRLERHYRDMCDIEFTVERGKLWMLQTRVGKRTPEAAFRIAVHMVDEGMIQTGRGRAARDRRPAGPADVPALRRVRRPHAPREGHERLPGRRRRQGRLRLRHRRGVGRVAARTSSSSARRPTPTTCAAWWLPAASSPAAVARPRTRRSWRAAWVVRACAAPSRSTSTPRPGSSVSATVRRSARATSSPSTARPARCSPAPCRSPTRWSCATSRARRSTTTSPRRSRRIMAHADGARRLRVRTNADTPDDAARARRFGAQGIGLCRTEHMFLGERRELVEKLIVAEDEPAWRPRSTSSSRCSGRTSPRSSRQWTACP